MAEYIEHEAAIAALNKVRDDQTVSKYLSVDDCLVARDAIERATKVLESLPAADVEPVRHGVWIEYQIPPIICCSNCDWATDVKEKNFNYCPNCAAKMDEG